MKILFYIHGITGGGGERVLATLANEFSNRGEDVYIATNTNSKFAYTINECISLCNLYHNIHSANNPITRLKNTILLRWNIRTIAKKVKPDIIVGMMSAMGCMVIFSTLGLGIPVIVSEHTNVSRKLGLWLDIKRKILYSFANSITVLTRWDKKKWRTKMKNIVYMPNPIKLKQIIPNSNERDKVIIAVGRINQWYIKGFDNLLTSWSVLCKSYPDWRLEIAGDGNKQSMQYLETLANKKGCFNYKLLGFRNDIDKLLERSSIFCLSSRVEGLPMALIEAMNSGCCCVSYDVETGPREIIQHNQSGLIAKNQDIEDLTKNLEQAISNEALRFKLSKNAPHAIKKYSLERIINRWYLLFNKIINNETI